MVWNTIKKGMDHLKERMDGTRAKKNRHIRNLKPRPKDETFEAEKKAEAERLEAPRPTPRIRPAQRPRALTLSPGHTISANRIADQSSSILLSKLPCELRQLIWRKFIGGHVYHLDSSIIGWAGPHNNEAIRTPIYGNLKNSCAAYLSKDGFCTGLDRKGIPCHSEEYRDFPNWAKSRSDCNIGVISILLSCRQAYSEAIDLVYSENTFVVTLPEVMLRFPKILLPHRLDLITSLRFRWSMNTPAYGSSDTTQRGCEEWCQVWKTLSEMKGLKTLRVELYQTYDSEWMDMEEAWRGFDMTWEQLSDADLESNIAPIREVTIPQDFVMSFGFKREEYQPAWDTLPCRVVSREDFL